MRGVRAKLQSSNTRIAFIALALFAWALFAHEDFRPTLAWAAIDSETQLSVPGSDTALPETFTCGMANGSSQASYGLMRPQVAPLSVHLSEEELIAILSRTSSTETYLSSYGLRLPTPSGVTASADVLKIIPTPDPSRPYLGVYHRNDQGGFFKTELAASTDLKTWHAVRTISDASSMPDIRLLPDSSLLYAEERNPSGHRPFIELQYYDHFRTLMSSGPPNQRLALPWTPGANADGTPHFGRIRYDGDIRTSRIELSHHFFAGGVNDQNAAGTLTGFSEWRDAPSKELNSQMKRLGYEQVGARELFAVGTTIYELVEGRQSNSAGWEAWRVFLANKCTGRITKLAPAFAGGARSIGNPRISFLTLPNGNDAIATTYFVFSEGANATPPGTHLQISVLPAQGDVEATTADRRTAAHLNPAAMPDLAAAQ